jgi:cytokinin dehydrogenase
VAAIVSPDARTHLRHIISAEHALPALFRKELIMRTDRRHFLGATFGATAAVASGANGLMTAAQAAAGGAQLLDARVNAYLSRDPAVRAAAADDFGRLIHKQPRAVLKASSGADIAALIRWAGSEGVKVAARGLGHSIYGRALADDGVVIDMSGLNTIRQLQPDRIVVDAGAAWSSVLEAALAQGLTPPVLTNYLGLSVGGTISVGGIGGSSSRYGMQTDQVVELDVVTGDGNELTCSATANPELFDGVRAGLGQCGIITRATLRLRRAPERVRRYQLFYSDLAALTADQQRVLSEQRFDQLQGAILHDGRGGWRYQLEAAIFYNREAAPDDKALLFALSDDRKAAAKTDLAYREDALAFAKFEKVLRSNGQWFHPMPWLLTFLRGSNAEQVAREILAGLTAEDIGPFGRITYYPLHTSAFRTPLVRLPDESVVFPFNVIRIPSSNDPAASERMVARNRELYDRIRKAGGLQYPVGAFAMSREGWTDHFGSNWPRFGEAKRRYDPGNLLAPGYDVF